MFSSNGTQVSSLAIPYIEDVFSTYLYTGTGAALTVTNNIDLSTYGGLTWIKGRSGATGHRLTDTARGATKSLASETTAAEATETTGLTAFGTTGFTIGADADYNTSAATYVSWTFREQPKFFDIVTWTGNATNRTIAHSLGAVPGSILVKRTDTVANWAVYHRSLANTQYLVLNSDVSPATGATWWNSTTPTSTVFSVGTDASVNASGGTYIAYIFAHNAGGFGLAGTDNVISCGSYTGTGAANNQINLGYEPQWVLVRNVSTTADWVMGDVMRGMPIGSNFQRLHANLAAAEDSVAVAGWLSVYSQGIHINGTGGSVNATGDTYIYIAIRRGPMAVPTLGTTVFDPIVRTGTGTAVTVSNSLVATDATLTIQKAGGGNTPFVNRLAGTGYYLTPIDAAAQYTQTETVQFDANKAVKWPDSTAFGGSGNFSGRVYVNYFLRRAPSFFDVVCYTGTGSNTTQTHNLGAVPELMIVKGRSGATAWQVYASALTNQEYVVLNTTASKLNSTTRWNSTTPTSSVFSLGTASEVNTNAATYVAYLFATAAGVSKVGGYTGNGTTQTIDCGLTAGARFVLIKRTDDVGGWYVYDTARGMSVLTDPYLFINDSVAETATLGSVTTVSTGFALNSTILAAINISAGTYIFLAIA